MSVGVGGMSEMMGDGLGISATGMLTLSDGETMVVILAY